MVGSSQCYFWLIRGISKLWKHVFWTLIPKHPDQRTCCDALGSLHSFSSRLFSPQNPNTGNDAHSNLFPACSQWVGIYDWTATKAQQKKKKAISVAFARAGVRSLRCTFLSSHGETGTAALQGPAAPGAQPTRSSHSAKSHWQKEQSWIFSSQQPGLRAIFPSVMETALFTLNLTLP